MCNFTLSLVVPFAWNILYSIIIVNWNVLSVMLVGKTLSYRTQVLCIRYAHVMPWVKMSSDCFSIGLNAETFDNLTFKISYLSSHNQYKHHYHCQPILNVNVSHIVLFSNRFSSFDRDELLAKMNWRLVPDVFAPLKTIEIIPFRLLVNGCWTFGIAFGLTLHQG